LGSAAGQGPLVFWVSLHRLHHEFADREGDPHSPNLFGTSSRQRLRGLLHAYIGWTVVHDVPNANFYARDLLKDPAMMTVNRYYYLWVGLGLGLPAAIVGAATASWLGALEGLLWGGLVRMFAFHNAIWWITSFAHRFGTRDFATRDLSRNNFWIAVPTLGESWHNNHHGFPSAAVLRFAWWQLDITGMAALLLEKVGLASDLQRPTLAARDARRSGAEMEALPRQHKRTE
jgi:stearoyl-CoA desaturase (delta-9 desaturase)